ncbi:5' DNA nuclease [Rhizobium sp. CNPSo 3464]|uniref:5' DNA nuclease n=1 Tax=Rhizobium sp. CNPSo 3464 TaxID=3021406 RepID=UPI0025507542|nr:5' DNA nuclease [Rhizobium sp. CNPSo 3464]MDK4739256.1 5' DNA nuclease [Rhizobium sp. CNPSo 3464]
MAKSTDTTQNSRAADASADLGRIAADMLRNSPILPIHPLMAHPAAAFAAATAIGLGFSSQMAGAFFGALQGAVEATNKLSVALDETDDTAVEEKPSAKTDGAGEAKVVKASPVAKPVEAKPVQATPVEVRKAEPKPVSAKAAPVKTPSKARAKAAVVAPEPVAAKPAAAPARNRKAVVKTDDLKRISGIGPKLEQVLNERGVLRFADIAAWNEADVERIDAELGFDGRIRRDDWIGQAKALQPRGRG